MRTRLRRVEVFDDAFGEAHPRHPKEMQRLPRKATSSRATRKDPVFFVSRSVREVVRGRGEGSVPGAGGPHDLIAAFEPGHET
ncbi:MAG: hypothetical protein H0T74_04330 [Rubrobacteraceae bacterium]|nr:hypothetical protein [Rubrobacteraceae bacterium]